MANGWFSGWFPTLCKSVPGVGIGFAAFEAVKREMGLK